MYVLELTAFLHQQSTHDYERTGASTLLVHHWYACTTALIIVYSVSATGPLRVKIKERTTILLYNAINSRRFLFLIIMIDIFFFFYVLKV